MFSNSFGDWAAFLRDYQIYTEKTDADGLVVYKVRRRSNLDHKYHVTRQTFPNSPEHHRRFEQLLQAREQGLLSASEIFLEQNESDYEILIVEPSLKANRRETLSEFLRQQHLTQVHKKKLYKNIADTLATLHGLKVYHCSLSP